MAEFSGVVYHQLDGKNRIRIPVKFKEGLGKNYHFVAGPHGCVCVYSQEALDRRMAELNAIRSSDPRAMKAKRLFQVGQEAVEEDGQGRTQISTFFRNHLMNKRTDFTLKEVVTIGMGDYLEIWSKEVFDDYNSDMTYDEAFTLLNL